MKESVLVFWSGGKDSMLALDRVLADGRFEVATLLTTVTAGYDRISIHGVRRSLLHRQAAALGLPLHEMPIPPDCSNAEYERRAHAALAPWREAGIRTVVCGDLYLEDVRAYRERLVGALGMSGLFPLWGEDTAALARRFVDAGYRAVLTCVDGHVLEGAFAGRTFSHALLADLPAGVDPCGENGEFHTFVYDGPRFAEPVAWAPGDVVQRDERWYYRDLLPR